MKVLVVDDVEANRRLLRATLAAEGFESVEAADGVEALERLRGQGADAVVSDVLMPRMDGYRLCREVRSDPALSRLPFVIYSATYTSPADEDLAGRVGADRFLRKPAPASEIVETIRAVAGREDPPAASPPISETDVMREYSEALVRKLEEKNAALEHSERELRTSSLALADAKKGLERQIEARTEELAAASAALRVINEELQERVVNLESRNAELRSLGETAELLQACRNPDEAQRVFAIALPRIFTRVDGGLHLTSGDRRSMTRLCAWGEGAGRAAEEFAVDRCWALRRGRTHLAGVSEQAPVCSHLGSDGARPSVCTPVTADGETIGVLSLTGFGAPASTYWSEMASAVAQQIALSLSNLRLRETLTRQATLDPLTGLANRRYLEDALQRELARSRRARSPFSLLMLDLDHFKVFNDSHGHDAGDELLRRMGGVLARSTRSEDIVCRYGGEEFLLALTGADREGAIVRAEGIRTAVRGLALDLGGVAASPVTVSIGISVFPDDGDSIPDLITGADRALYRAKSGGRDRIVAIADA